MKLTTIGLLTICFSLTGCMDEAQDQTTPKTQPQQTKQPLLDLFAKPKLTTEKAKQEEALILKAIADDPSAQIALANMYEKDNKQKRALFWYQQAAQIGTSGKSALIAFEQKILQQEKIAEAKKNEQYKLARIESIKQRYQTNLTEAESGSTISYDTLMKYYPVNFSAVKDPAFVRNFLKKLIAYEAKKPTFKLVELKLEAANTNRDKNVPSAIALAKKLAESGSVDAAYFLGWLHQFGSLLDKDIAKAIYWYKKAAELADIRAYRSLGWIYHSHYNDNKAAAHWYEKSANLEDQVSQFNLAVLYHLGTGVDKNLKKASQLYKAAADAGHNSAKINLANMYENGIGVSKNKELSKQYYASYLHINPANKKRESQLNIEPATDTIKLSINPASVKRYNMISLYQRSGIYSHSIDISNLPIIENQWIYLSFINIPEIGFYSLFQGTKDNLFQWVHMDSMPFDVVRYDM